MAGLGRVGHPATPSGSAATSTPASPVGTSILSTSDGLAAIDAAPGRTPRTP